MMSDACHGVKTLEIIDIVHRLLVQLKNTAFKGKPSSK